MKNKFAALLVLLTPFLIQAQTVSEHTLQIDLKPQKVTIDISCEKIKNSEAGDDIEVKFRRSSKSHALHQLLLKNAQEVLALKSCEDFEQLASVPTARWIQHQTPAFPLSVPSMPLYNFKVGTLHWLYVKDLGASTENQPFYSAFYWQKDHWQVVPDFFNGLSFYGFEGKNVITGFYEGAFFVKHTSSLSGHRLIPITKQVWVGDKLVKHYSPDEEIVFER